MKFIQVSKTVMVNPELISTIEFAEVNGERVLVVKVEGTAHIVSANHGEFFKDLIKAGTEANNQFFAG